MINKTLIAILSTAFLLSCGTEESDSEKNDKQREDDKAYYDGLMKAGKDQNEEQGYIEIPKCTRGKEEKLIYVPYEEVFLVCRDGMWNYLLYPEDPKDCPVTKPVDETVPVGEGNE